MQFTLIADGSSDRALIPILKWLLWEVGIRTDLIAQWADLRHLRNPPLTLRGKIEAAVELYPCDLLFVHRDAEDQPAHLRRDEIDAIMQAVDPLRHRKPHVCVVPVRMQEAWLLIDESAIRNAAANPNGTTQLELPAVADIEAIADPKERLFALIKSATGLNRRRLAKFSLPQARLRVSELIQDYSSLRGLSAFQDLEQSLRDVVGANFRAFC